MGVRYSSSRLLTGLADNGHIIAYGSSMVGCFLLGVSHANNELGDQLELIVGTSIAGLGVATASGFASDYQTHCLNVETNFPPDKRLSAKRCLVRPIICTALGATAYAAGYFTGGFDKILF